MKKKLTLKKEALKNLTPAQLDHVAGGASYVAPDTTVSSQCNFL
jgi:hypothetical protein